MRQRLSWGAGIAIGMGIGVAMGTALDNMAVGIGLGIAIGLVFAIAIGSVGRRRKPPASSQDSEDGPAEANPDENDPDSAL